MNPYESDRLLSEYLLFHFGTEEDLLGGLPGPTNACGFATRLVDRLLLPCEGSTPVSALDIGCAVGGSSFALSQTANSVLGIDFSSSFIRAATELAERGTLSTKVAVEGNRTQPFTAQVPSTARRDRVRFEVGDAMNLRPDIGEFDVVLAANLLCRLPEPKQFLDRLPQLLRKGGQLLLTTPFTWLEEFTPIEHWIGGTPETGPSADALRSVLEPNFTLDHSENLPFLIREHSRKFQYSVALGTRWIRK